MQTKMSPKVGLWIDHKQAVIVTLSDKEENVAHLPSHVEKQPRREGDSPMKGSYESLIVHADNSQQREATGHLNHYYDQVITHLREAGAILILGPGEAKEELKKRLEAQHLGKKIEGMHTEDKMTENQLVAKVRGHFAK